MRDDETAPLPPSWLDAADDYHRPPETPREEIWAGIAPELFGRSRSGAVPAGWFGVRPRLRLAVATAAALIVGVALGRASTSLVGPGPDDGPEAAATATTGPGDGVSSSTVSPPLRAAALDHLGRSGSLLTRIRTDARDGRVDVGVGEWGRNLLEQTRLLLDSPVADDAELRALLEDLELVLAQVAVLRAPEGLDEERLREELRIIARGLERGDVLPRIQAVVPDGADDADEDIETTDTNQTTGI